MAGVTHDDGFHEIQLNGKQLVFLFMAVTVVSVVIFLCGVLVGRGVRLDGGVPIETVAAAADDAPPPVEGGGNSDQPVASNEVTSFTTRLEGATQPAEKLSPPAAVPVPRSESADVPPPAPAPPAEGSRPGQPEASTPAPSPPPPAKAAAPTGPSEPSGPGLAVQVSAFRVRQDADVLANRLIGKGYTAYVVAPAPGAPALFRVRVGKFKERREADQVVAKLKKEEQFDPWIVR